MANNHTNAVDVIIGVSWLTFWIYWLAAAAKTKATRTHSRPGFGIRVVLLVVIIAAARAGIFRGHSTERNPLLQGIGLGLFVSGLALALWARAYIGRNWGPPMAEKEHPDLVTTGPYRYVRHPIYSGIIAAMIGTAIAINVSWLVVVVIPGGYFVYSATIEERNMERLFPDAYPAYKRSTKMLIPFIY